MAFNRKDYDLEEWLASENANFLQKVCNIFDTDGKLVEQYKTRYYIVPVGKYNYFGKLSISAPSLYRAFSYDDEGSMIASIPEIREWTQACEDAAQGALPPIGDPAGVPAGLKVASSSFFANETSSVPANVETVIQTYTVNNEDGEYLRSVNVTSENRSLVTVKHNSNILMRKRTYFTDFNIEFNFGTANGGIYLNDGDVVEVTAIHYNINSPDTYSSTVGVVRA